MLDPAELDEAIVNAADRPSFGKVRSPAAEADAERRVRITVKRVLEELPSDVTVAELLELLET